MAENKGMNITVSKTNVKDIDNTALIEAIKEMRANFNPETQNKVINLSLKATFFVPAVIANKTELVEGQDKRMKFEDRQTAKFLLVSNPDRGNYFPAYTDRELLKGFKTEQPFQGFAMRFADLANLSEQTPNVRGFIINPDTDKLPYTKEILDTIKKTIQEAKRKAQEAQAAAGGEQAESKPNISVTTNENPEE